VADRPQVLSVIVGSNLGNWFAPTAMAVARLLELEPNWDSYGAPPVERVHAEAILNLLTEVMEDDTPVPAVVPTSIGGVQVEWHIAGIDLEIETFSQYRFGLLFVDEDTGDEWDEVVTNDLARLYQSVAILGQRFRAKSGC